MYETKGNRRISGSIDKTTNIENSLDKPQLDTINYVESPIKHHNEEI